MRKVTENAVHAFRHAQPLSRSNTQVEIRPWQGNEDDVQVILTLYDNPIARYRAGDKDMATLRVCDGGWQTNTTKDRLNGLPGVRVHQKKGDWFLNGEPWSGEWTYVRPVVAVRHEPTRDIPWVVQYPSKHGGGSVAFHHRAAAEAFARVEAANLGVPTVGMEG